MSRSTLLLLSLLLFADAALATDGGDAGAVDAGGLDAGDSDAGLGEDAGFDPALDAGDETDSGPADSGPADAGPGPAVDAGLPPAVDGGGIGCQLRCEGNVLNYCDALTGEPQAIDCDEVDGRCGVLSFEWGLDCLLPEDAPCSSGYAEGQSRCDPAPPLFCNMNTCRRSPGEDTIPTIPDDSLGLGETRQEDPSPLACLGCDNSQLPFSLSALFVVLALRQLGPGARRRRRAAR